MSRTETPPERLNPAIARSLPFAVAKRALFLPAWKTDNGRLEVWITTHTDPHALDQFRLASSEPVKPVRVSREQLLDALQRVHQEHGIAVENVLDELPPSMLASQLAEKPDLLEADNDAPIIQLVNSLIIQALRNRASDIHIEPFENNLIVRFRVDGLLHEALRPPKPVQAPLMSRIKVMAGLNIAEKRLPQDGALRVQVASQDIDVRVSVLPGHYGERLVMRLLEKQGEKTGLSELGLTDAQMGWIRSRMTASHGIMLVTGPTGSGKSTTLYSILSAINTSEKNIITIEDPIEYSLAGVGQIQVAPKIGLTFASGLRSILRQDPDVIMVGEIRDLETAEIAIQASLTGHLVFSTLHTNDSVGAVVRLVNMGIEPFLVSSSVDGVVAQRLVRRLCERCKEAFAPEASLLRASVGERRAELLEGARFYRPKGCAGCMGTGYLGRTAVFELLTMSSAIRALIDRRASDLELHRVAREEGMTSLREAGLIKAAEGLTSLEEVFRVTQERGEVV
ncbi:Type II secretion system protein E [Candidatus Magnetaquicoccaceae bacterium FCR-1]|uniref:Type II secretion system protein E n=1 Tax=Candidatus Magnetaquiglobus chichijimensis TaxID=3141448 RepID=A0ABQ0C6M3_9PROT